MRFFKASTFAVATLLISVLGTVFANAQTTVGYRQINLTCRVQCSAPQQSDFLIKPWGIAFLPGQSFLITENNIGRVDTYDAAGQLGPGLSLPLPTGSSALNSRPTGIVADPDANFVLGTSHFQFFVATEEGTIIGFSVDNNGQPESARVLIDHSANSAVYTGITLLHPSCCNPKLAVANFHDAQIEVYGLSATALPGAFEDPNLPQGYAPYNIQVIGNHVFVAYAQQDGTKRAPLVGEGLGIVSIFDQDGNFVRRFISDGGKLNAPWGLTAASANFGPFGNDILIGNIGDTRIGIYDPTTGEFLGPLADSEQKLILNPGLRTLTFRNDRVGNPDTLYFVAAPETNGVEGGLFASVGTGTLTSTSLFVQEALVGMESSLFAAVNPVTGNDTVTGKVVFFDDGVVIGDDGVVSGVAAIFPVFNRTGVHTISAEYQGTDIFLPSIDQLQIIILGPPTTTTLTAPTSAGPGTPVTFRARTLSAIAIVTGSVTFQEGSHVLGVVPLDEHDTATLIVTTLAAGTHSVTASYAGPDFQSSSSAPVLVSIGGDFQFTSNLQSVTVPAGNSVDTTLTISPSGGFVGPFTFTCLAPGGISCSFSPATLNVNGTAATTRLTIKTSSTIARNSRRLGFPFLAFGLFGTLLMRRRVPSARSTIILIASLMLGFSFVACGGYGRSNTPPTTPPGTTSTVTVTATSGSISHSTNVSVTVQ